MDWLPEVGADGVVVTVCVTGVMSAVSALLIVIGVINQRRAQASRAWPAAAGQVVLSQIGTQSGENGPSYFPMVHYTYNAAGRAMQNDRIVFGGGVTGNLGPAEKILARYPLGTSVTVYYDPANPQSAVLERRSGSTGFLFALAGFMLVLSCGIAGCVTAGFLSQVSG